MVGVDSFTRRKVVGSATFHRKSACQSKLISRASLHCLPSRAATTHVCPERLVPCISSTSRCYSPSSFTMEPSASAGHELLSFINASPTRESTLSWYPLETFDAF